MKTPDLQDAFIDTLIAKEARRADLENRIADILGIEKEAAYRRLSGKVNFSIREMGILANEFGISLDRLLRSDQEQTMMPFILESPAQKRSIEELCDVIDRDLEALRIINLSPAESGNIYSSLPLEFFTFFPMLTKFMFFKWGHYFVGTEEFNDFSSWELPERLAAVPGKIGECTNYSKLFYIWDSSLVWAIIWEMDSLYKMHVITAEEILAVKKELKDLLKNLEKFLSGTFTSDISFVSDMEFYVSTIHLGFSSSYYESAAAYGFSYRTNFSFAVSDNCYDTFKIVKDWIDSLKNMSTKLSQSGRIERKLFFETQYKIIDQEID